MQTATDRFAHNLHIVSTSATAHLLSLCQHGQDMDELKQSGASDAAIKRAQKGMTVPRERTVSNQIRDTYNGIQLYTFTGYANKSFRFNFVW